jgi:hypothetical protein
MTNKNKEKHAYHRPICLYIYIYINPHNTYCATWLFDILRLEKDLLPTSTQEKFGILYIVTGC